MEAEKNLDGAPGDGSMNKKEEDPEQELSEWYMRREDVKTRWKLGLSGAGVLSERIAVGLVRLCELFC